MPEQIDVSALREGDVLLYEGEGIISWAIKKLDGSKMSHTALYTGVKSGTQMVAEAIAEGLVERDLTTSIEDLKITVRRLVKDTADMQPVLAVSDEYVANDERYAYEQIVLLAILSIARKIEGSSWTRWIISRLVSAASLILTALLGGGKEPMICSEFVFRCYDEADDGGSGDYKLDIPDRYPQLAKPFGVAAPARNNYEEGSLLDALLASDGDVPEPPAVKLGVAAPSLEQTVEQIEADLERYKAALDDPDVEAPTAVTDEELFGGVAGMARTLQKGAKGFAATSLSLRDIIRQLFGTNPNLVTPAGLLNTTSLEDVGQLN